MGQAKLNLNKEKCLFRKTCRPLPGSTPADLCFFVGSLPSGQGVLNLLCRGLPQTSFVSRNKDWASPPHLTYRVPSYKPMAFPYKPPHTTLHSFSLQESSGTSQSVPLDLPGLKRPSMGTF